MTSCAPGRPWWTPSLVRVPAHHHRRPGLPPSTPPPPALLPLPKPPPPRPLCLSTPPPLLFPLPPLAPRLATAQTTQAMRRVGIPAPWRGRRRACPSRFFLLRAALHRRGHVRAACAGEGGRAARAGSRCALEVAAPVGGGGAWDGLCAGARGGARPRRAPQHGLPPPPALGTGGGPLPRRHWPPPRPSPALAVSPSLPGWSFPSPACRLVVKWEA